MLKQIMDLIYQYTDSYNVNITPDSLIMMDLGINSLELIRILGEIENTFDIEIPDREIVNFRKVSDILNYIESNQ